MLQGTCQGAQLEPQHAESALLLAPAWHTRALVGLMLAVAATASLIGQAFEQPPPATSLLARGYLPLALVNLGLLLYVCRLGLERSIFARLFVQLRYHRRRLLGDLAWGGALAIALIGAEIGLQALVGFPESAAAHTLLPAGAGEHVAWIGVAALVGFSEELVYRGYLQRQLTALSGRVPFGVAAQALLFGIAHGEQGAWAVARFALYGLALGWVAATRRSLAPCVLCHVVVDWCAGWGG